MTITLDGTTGITTPGLTNTGTSTFTSVAVSGAVTLSGGTANGVAYLNASKVLTTGSALTFDGTLLSVTGNTKASGYSLIGASALVVGGEKQAIVSATTDTYSAWQQSGGITATFGVNGTGAYSGSFTNQPYVFRTNNTEVARFDTSGNLGIGATPSAWVSYQRGVDFGTWGSLSSRAEFVLLGSNCYLDSTGTTWRYKNTGYASYLYQSSGAFVWNTAASGTAGAVITWTSPMALDSSGSFSVGTTSGYGGRVTIVPASTPTTVAGGNQIQIGEATSNSGYRLQLGYINDATVGYIGSIQAYSGGVVGTLLLNGAGGKVGIGTVSPAGKLDVSDTNCIVYSTGTGGYGSFYARGSGTNSSYIFMGNATSGEQVRLTCINGGDLTFSNTASVTERMRLDSSGNLLVGTTTAGAKLCLQVVATGTGILERWAATGGTAAYFEVNSVNVGSITTTTTATAYNTSSDYRLKNITGPITNSGAYIDSLKPVEGTWKTDGSTFVGLIAHEVQEASRTVVATGIKDGEEMQGMDYSSAELIANLIAEIKSLRVRLNALESK